MQTLNEELETLHYKFNWRSMQWDGPPSKSGRYLVGELKTKKVYFKRWNGIGWSDNTHNITHWMPEPRLEF